MDEELRRLERAAAADHADEAAARALDRALLRSGDEAAVARRYEVKFRCTLRFDALAPTSDSRVRDCERCERPVHLVETPAQLAEHVAAARCVSIDLDQVRAAYDFIARDARLHSAADPGRPCVVDSELPLVDLDAVDLHREAFGGLGQTRVRQLRALPWSVDEAVVHVAVAGPIEPNLRAVLERSFAGRQVRFALAQPDALDRAIDRAYAAPPERYFTGLLLQ